MTPDPTTSTLPKTSDFCTLAPDMRAVYLATALESMRMDELNTFQEDVFAKTRQKEAGALNKWMTGQATAGREAAGNSFLAIGATMSRVWRAATRQGFSGPQKWSEWEGGDVGAGTFAGIGMARSGWLWQEAINERNRQKDAVLRSWSADEFKTACAALTTAADKRALIARMREQLTNPKFYKPRERSLLYEAIRKEEDGLLIADVTAKAARLTETGTAALEKRLLGDTGAQTEVVMKDIEGVRGAQRTFQRKATAKKITRATVMATIGFLLPRAARYGAEVVRQYVQDAGGWGAAWDKIWEDERKGASAGSPPDVIPPPADQYVTIGGKIDSKTAAIAELLKTQKGMSHEQALNQAANMAHAQGDIEVFDPKTGRVLSDAEVAALRRGHTWGALYRGETDYRVRDVWEMKQGTKVWIRDGQYWEQHGSEQPHLGGRTSGVEAGFEKQRTWGAKGIAPEVMPETGPKTTTETLSFETLQERIHGAASWRDIWTQMQGFREDGSVTDEQWQQLYDTFNTKLHDMYGTQMTMDHVVFDDDGNLLGFRMKIAGMPGVRALFGERFGGAMSPRAFETAMDNVRDIGNFLGRLSQEGQQWIVRGDIRLFGSGHIGGLELRLPGGDGHQGVWLNFDAKGNPYIEGGKGAVPPSVQHAIERLNIHSNSAVDRLVDALRGENSRSNVVKNLVDQLLHPDKYHKNIRGAASGNFFDYLKKNSDAARYLTQEQIDELLKNKHVKGNKNFSRLLEGLHESREQKMHSIEESVVITPEEAGQYTSDKLPEVKVGGNTIVVNQNTGEVIIPTGSTVVDFKTSAGGVRVATAPDGSHAIVYEGRIDSTTGKATALKEALNKLDTSNPEHQKIAGAIGEEASKLSEHADIAKGYPIKAEQMNLTQSIMEHFLDKKGTGADASRTAAFDAFQKAHPEVKFGSQEEFNKGVVELGKKLPRYESLDLRSVEPDEIQKIHGFEQELKKLQKDPQTKALLDYFMDVIKQRMRPAV